MTREEAVIILRCVEAHGSLVKEAKEKAIEALQQKSEEECKWIHYDYRTMCPKEHDVDNPYWRIPENQMDVLKYCPYCGKEIEVEE